MAEVISKSSLVDKVAEAVGISKKDTKAVVDALIGFGTFKKAQRASRKCCNLRNVLRYGVLRATVYASIAANTWMHFMFVSFMLYHLSFIETQTKLYPGNMNLV